MAKRLLIVESPTKAKTLRRYVGKDCTVKASVGHVKDLPKNRMGVDVEHNFAVELEVIRGKKKVLNDLRSAAKKADEVFLAPDPDREGEAIAWHIAEEVRPVNPKVHRVTFNEITPQAVLEAIKHPGPLDRNLYNAQQARRVLDRLVGYEISPLLWDKVQRGLSAGRVQSVAVRLVVEREQEIEAFRSQEYWTIEETLKPRDQERSAFKAQLFKIDGQPAQIADGGTADQIRRELSPSEHRLSSIEKKGRTRKPHPPFITSTLQQAAAASLRSTAKKTMRTAQQLYEGVEISGEGSVGLITYMRTDSTRLSLDAVHSARSFIEKTYGKQYLPPKPVAYKSKKGAQDAHEAIRPTMVEYTPERVKSSLSADQFKLYELIWRNFLSCQMAAAEYHQTTVTIEGGSRYLLRATGSVCVFPGWLVVARAGKEEEPEVTFPPMVEGELLQVEDIQASQHFTQPPPRFNEGTLVKELEERGIGRPSTYSTILETIQSKRYVEKQQGRFRPTQLGKLVTGLLIESFPDILGVDFTAEMEKKLDEVEEGKVDWVKLVGEFYAPFSETMKRARQEMRDVKREEIPTEHVCDLCSGNMVVKWGRNGYFLACSSYPRCRNTKEIQSWQGGQVQVAPTEDTGEVCEKCGRPMVVRRGRYGRFLACSGYPDCKNARSVSLGVGCPKCSQGQMVERQTRKGRLFYSCNRYPECDFSTWQEPVAERCPNCGSGILVRRENKKEGAILACPFKTCGFTRASGSE